MRTYNFSSFEQALKKLPLKRHDTVMVHSSLLAFGLPTDIKPREMPVRLFQTIQELIGQEGTLVVPTFNFDFCIGKPFDRQRTPSKGMGVFSEYVRSLVQSKRSYHPMQSVSVVGKSRDLIVENDTVTAFSPEGAFDRLLALQTKVVLLGTDLNSVSMIHWVEEKLNVPYRYWKSFSGIYVDNLISSQRSYKMFVRSLKSNPKLNMRHIEDQLVKEKKIQVYHFGGGAVKCFNLNDFVSIAVRCINSNPYFFVANHSDFEKNFG